jgi:hypothetical protein
MLIPLYVMIYTIQFARWLHQRRQQISAMVSVYVIAIVSFAISTVVLWRVMK